MSDLLLTWEQFLYELSALGFNYDKCDHVWRNESGAAVTDEALRDIHAHWPVFISAALKLWSDGAKMICIETNWENGVFVARLRVVE
jgi:hypothetical protein